jgi:hypothetical protein
MDVLAHIRNRQKENVAMETLNPSVEGKFVSTFQMEGAQNFTPLTNSIEGPNKSTNNTRTFQ